MPGYPKIIFYRPKGARLPKKKAPPKQKTKYRQRKPYNRTKQQYKSVRPTNTPEEHGTLSQTSLKFGSRPKYTLGVIRKVIKANENKMVYGLRGLTRFGGSSGYFPLCNGQSATGQPVSAPLWLFDITSAPNDISGTITQPSTGYQTVFANETATCGAITFYNTSTPNLALENVAGGSSTVVNNYPTGQSVLRWVQAKLMLYCPTTQPTKFNIMLVRFKRHELVPKNVAVGGNDSKTDDFSIAFYQTLLKKYMMNPVEVSNPTADTFMDILHSYTTILNPKESSDPTNTTFKEVDIFKWFNRKCIYNWDDDDKMSLVSTTDFPANVAENRCTVRPTSRIFLLVRALSGYKSTSQALDSTIQPSFDLVLRTCHTQFV